MKARVLLALAAALFTGLLSAAEKPALDSRWDFQLSTVSFGKSVSLKTAISQLKDQLQREHPGIEFAFVLTKNPSKYKAFRKITHRPAPQNLEGGYSSPEDALNLTQDLKLESVPVIEVCKYLANLTNYRIEKVGTRMYFSPFASAGTFKNPEHQSFNVVRGGNEFFKGSPRIKNKVGERVFDARPALARIGCVFCEGDTAKFYPDRQWLDVRTADDGIGALYRLSGCVRYDPKWLARKPAWRVKELLDTPVWFDEGDFPPSPNKSR